MARNRNTAPPLGGAVDVSRKMYPSLSQRPMGWGVYGYLTFHFSTSQYGSGIQNKESAKETPLLPPLDMRYILWYINKVL